MMSVSTIDALAVVRVMEEGGVVRARAGVIADTVKKAAEVQAETLATKEDRAALRPVE